MKKNIVTSGIILITLLLSACSNHVQIKALKPAEIDRATTTKNIAVVAFNHDRVGLASKIETNLGSFRIENQPFFTVVNRSNIDQVIREQKFHSSGLVNTKDIVDVGKLLGAQALISGDVSRLASNDTRFYEQRMKCKDKKCKEYYYYKVGCTKRHISLSANIKMVDVALGDIIYSDNIAEDAVYKKCRDDNRALPTKESVGEMLASSIAKSFTYKLTPHYRYFKVVLLDDPDLDYTDKQEDLLEFSLKYIEQNRYDKAIQLLMELIDSTNQQSYVALYNLGVVEEALGHYGKAKKYYEQADRLVVEPVEAISIAINRINAAISEYDLTMKQLQR